MGANGGVAVTLRKFVQSAVDNTGFTMDEAAEIIVQTSPYVGLWRANTAMMVLEDAFPHGKVPRG